MLGWLCWSERRERAGRAEMAGLPVLRVFVLRREKTPEWLTRGRTEAGRGGGPAGDIAGWLSLWGDFGGGGDLPGGDIAPLAGPGGGACLAGAPGAG